MYKFILNLFILFFVVLATSAGSTFGAPIQAKRDAVFARDNPAPNVNARYPDIMPLRFGSRVNRRYARRALEALAQESSIKRDSTPDKRSKRTQHARSGQTVQIKRQMPTPSSASSVTARANAAEESTTNTVVAASTGAARKRTNTAGKMRIVRRNMNPSGPRRL